jgi:hypothetical protein
MDLGSQAGLALFRGLKTHLAPLYPKLTPQRKGEQETE